MFTFVLLINLIINMKNILLIILYSLLSLNLFSNDNYPKEINVSNTMRVGDLFDSCGVLKYDTLTIIAMFLNTEVRYGLLPNKRPNGTYYKKSDGTYYMKTQELNVNEIKDVASVLFNRAECNFENRGDNIFKQMFSPMQFSGVAKRKCRYFKKKNSNNPLLGKDFYFNPKDKICQKLYDNAKCVYNGDYRTNFLYFMVLEISTDERQIELFKINDSYKPINYAHAFASKLNKKV